MLVDQWTDPANRMLYGMQFEYDTNVIEGIKTASVSPVNRDTLSYTAFADDVGKLFPVNTPDNALLSACYAVKQAAHVPERVMRRLKNAVDLYGLPWPEIISVKEASAPEERGDFVFEKAERLFVKSAADVQRADDKISQEMAHLSIETRKEAYTRLCKLAAKYQMKVAELSQPALRYAGLASCELGPLMDHIDARVALCTPGSEADGTYRKIAEMATKTAQVSRGYYTDPVVLDKLATLLAATDKAAGLDSMYGRQLLDPYLTVYNTTDKLAALNTVAVADKEYTQDQLRQIPLEVYQQAFGDDISGEIAPSGQVEAEAASTIVPTMPRDMQMVFNKLVTTHRVI